MVHHEIHLTPTKACLCFLNLQPYKYNKQNNKLINKKHSHTLDQSIMPTPNTTTNVLERSPSLKDMDKRLQEKSSLSKHLQRVYPLSMHKSNSSLSLSSLSLSQNSNDSSFNSSISSWDHKMAMPFHGMFKSWERRDVSIEEAIKKWRLRCREFGLFGKKNQSNVDDDEVESGELDSLDVGELKRCKWITKSSGMFSAFG